MTKHFFKHACTAPAAPTGPAAEGSPPAQKAGPAGRYLRPILLILWSFAWAFALGTVTLWFGKVGYGIELFRSYFSYLVLLALNLLPVLAVFWAFYLLFNRAWCATLASGILILGLALVNYFKLLFRGDPLLASDVSNISEGLQISSRYDLTVTPAIAAAAAGVLLAAVLSGLLVRARMHGALPRLAGFAALIAVCAALWFGAYSSEAVYQYTANLKVTFADSSALNEWNETDQYVCRGFLYPLLHSLTDLGPSKPDGYSKKAAETLSEEYAGGDIAEDKKVNVIAIMLEAYYDFSTYDEIFSFETDPYAFYHQLQSESLSGRLVTNIFAAGTVDTERCFLTGSMQLYEYRRSAGSYAKYFGAQGYYTEFCHPGYGWFYNRQNVSEYLGFDSSNFFEGRYRMPDGYGIMNDDALLPDLRQLYLERTGDGTPYFNFTVTYQNHGPYAVDYLYDTVNTYVPRGTLSDESYCILNNYFWGIKLTDDSLRSFIESFRSDSEPVVIVLFGDHKPWLGDGASVYAELGIDLSCADDASFYNYYETQYLIWANDAAKAALSDGSGTDAFSGDGGSFSPCFLMMRLFDACGWTGDSYMNALRALYASGVDVVNESGRCRQDGVLTQDLSGDAAELLSQVRILEYYRAKEG